MPEILNRLLKTLSNFSVEKLWGIVGNCVILERIIYKYYIFHLKYAFHW